MKLDKLFAVTVVVLVGIFAVQLSVRLGQKPGTYVHASWAFSPDSVDEAKKLANQIVLGRVTSVKRANDIVIKAPGEAGNEIRIPVEVVTIRLEKSYKGGKPETIEVFHTGLSRGDSPAEKGEPRGNPPPKPPDGVDRRARLPKPSLQQGRTFMLDDDPPYTQGDQVVLFLTDGPTVTAGSTAIKTKRVVSPEGRFHVASGNRLGPVTSRKFAGKLNGRPLQELEAAIGSG